MRRISSALVLLLLIGIAQADEAFDKKTLQTAGIFDEDSALLEFFRDRTLTDDNRAKIEQLVAKLGSDEFRDREKAFKDLLNVGNAASSLLRQAIRQPDQDVEVLRSCERLLTQTEKVPGNTLAAAAARRAGQHKPDGLAEVLLAYLPFAEDENVLDNVQAALAAVAWTKDQPNPVLVTALADALGMRRAGAAEALLAGGPSVHAGAKKLLGDADALVRLRVANSLVNRKDRDAFPVLIALLTELPMDKIWRAEEPLLRLAGNSAPQTVIGKDDEGRKKYRDAWSDWYQKDGVKVDLARLDNPPLLGYTVAVFMDRNFANGSIVEYGKDGKPRWELKGLQFPVDAQVLNGGERVLVAEANGLRVTERTTSDNKVQWERRFQAQVVSCRRLANGNTFMACQNQLVEVDRNGKDVFTYNQPNYDIMGAQKLRGGDYAFVTNTGSFVRVDANGKVTKTFGIGQGLTYSGIEVLPSGNVLVPQYSLNKVVEYDTEGKSVWEAVVQNPTSVQRLPDGKTLVASMLGQELIELDREGKKVWEQKIDGRPWRGIRR